MKGFSRGTITGNVMFMDNFGINGGAINLVDGSYIVLNSTANMLFLRNSAVVMGGAIHSTPLPEVFGTPPVPCLLQFNCSDNLSVTFEQNMASGADQAIFISNPGQCCDLFNTFNFIPPTPNQVQTVMENVSLTTRPKLKDNILTVMLGEVFYLNPIVKDHFNRSSTGFGYLALLGANDSEYYATVSNYTMVGPSALGIDNFTQNTQFFIEGPHSNSSFVLELVYDLVNTYKSGSTHINVNVIHCKTGYYYSTNTRKCECVKSHHVICIENSVCIQHGYWYDEHRQLAVPCPTLNCDSTRECPNSMEQCQSSPGYCNITAMRIPDEICSGKRGKYLCSGCRDGHAFNFGGFRCVSDTTCKAYNTFMIMLAVITYWLVFVAVLLVVLTLQLKVGSGFMYGLVYYFSIVIIFDDHITDNKFLIAIHDISISFTQLDPRMILSFIEVCFSKDMNALHHLMMRYVTPVFIVSIIATIVWLSKYCRCPKQISLAENSPIHAICLLILFSYTSLTHTSFQILRPMIINGKVMVQALPNVSYFDPKDHLPFAIVGLLVEFLIALPICILLILAPCLSRKLNFVRLKLMPILDEFQACYRPECRWFAGFYFLARQLIYLASIIPQEDLPQANLAVQCLIAVVLFIHTTFQPYKNRWLNVLDTVLLMDLGLLAVHAAINPLTVSGLNNVINVGLPYLLILIPSCYLFLVVVVLLFTRMHRWYKTHFFWFRSRSRSTFVELDSTPSSTTVGVDAQSNSSAITGFKRLKYLVNEDREPLLADM
jgi:hypothetical protein